MFGWQGRFETCPYGLAGGLHLWRGLVVLKMISGLGWKRSGKEIGVLWWSRTQRFDYVERSN